MPTPPNSAVVNQLVAGEALTQLNRLSIFPNAAEGNYAPEAFQVGEQVTFRRARIVKSQNYDPRSGVPANKTDPGYFSSTLTMECLWTNGFQVYGSDNAFSISKYTNEYGYQIGAAIQTDNDDYFYNKFRTVNVPTTGICNYGAQAPVGIVASQSGGQLTNFNKQLLINAGVQLNSKNVPPNDRFAILSSAAGGAFLGDSVLVEGFVAATAGGGQLLQGGMAPGQFVPRYGFMCGSSNAVGSQVGQANLDTNGIHPTLAIASATPNTLFIMPDFAATTYLGAVDVTVTTTGTLQNVAVGQIAQIAPSQGDVVAFGLILRVLGNVITLVPFSPAGTLLQATQINPATALFSIPTIGSISVAYHKQSLIFATRKVREPSEGSGVQATTMADPKTNLVVQIFSGQYLIDNFSETQRYAMLIGAALSDQRKACLMLSN